MIESQGKREHVLFRSGPMVLQAFSAVSSQLDTNLYCKVADCRHFICCMIAVEQLLKPIPCDCAYVSACRIILVTYGCLTCSIGAMSCSWQRVALCSFDVHIYQCSPGELLLVPVTTISAPWILSDLPGQHTPNLCFRTPTTQHYTAVHHTRNHLRLPNNAGWTARTEPMPMPFLPNVQSKRLNSLHDPPT
jgi:hypothetical protein